MKRVALSILASFKAVRKTRKRQGISIATLLLGLLVTPMLNAFAQSGPSAEAVLPNDAVIGMTYGDWGAAWQQWLQSIPADNNPALDNNGDKCAEQQSAGPVFYLVGAITDEVPDTPLITEVTRDCTVPANRYLFFPILNVSSDTVPTEPPPPAFFAPTEAAQRQLAASFGNLIDVDTLRVTVNGKKVKKAKDLEDFRAQSPAFHFFLPENNIFGIDEPEGGGYFGVTDGYWMMLNPLPAGDHQVHFEGAFVSDEGYVIFALDVTYNLTVE